MTTKWIVNVPGGDWSDPVFGLTAMETKKRTTKAWAFALLALLTLAGAALLAVPSQPEVKGAVKPAPRSQPSLLPVVRALPSAPVPPAQKAAAVVRSRAPSTRLATSSRGTGPVE